LPTVAAAEDDDEDVAGSVDGDEVEMEPVEPMLEPPDDAGPVGWPMPDFCPLTVSARFKPRGVKSGKEFDVLLSCDV
jgi:hypothetical protein